MTDLSSRERLIRALDEADRIEAEIEAQDLAKDESENARLADRLERAV